MNDSRDAPVQLRQKICSAIDLLEQPHDYKHPAKVLLVEALALLSQSLPSAVERTPEELSRALAEKLSPSPTASSDVPYFSGEFRPLIDAMNEALMDTYASGRPAAHLEDAWENLQLALSRRLPSTAECTSDPMHTAERTTLPRAWRWRWKGDGMPWSYGEARMTDPAAECEPLYAAPPVGPVVKTLVDDYGVTTVEALVLEMAGRIERLNDALKTSRSSIGASVEVTAHGLIDLLATAFEENHYPGKAEQLRDYKGFIQDKPLVKLFAPSASGEVEALRAALAEIAKGEGAFNRDPLQHASNCIESMKRIASNALTSTSAKAGGNDG